MFHKFFPSEWKLAYPRVISSSSQRPILPLVHRMGRVCYRPTTSLGLTKHALTAATSQPKKMLLNSRLTSEDGILGLVRVLKILDNSTDYSIQNTARQALFLPTSREAKYKAKAAIDAFFMRFGDVLQAGIVYAGSALGFVLSSFAALNVALTVVWFFVAAALAREYKKRSAPPPRNEIHDTERLRPAVLGH